MLGLAFADPPRPFRLLCLGAHADDIEIGCGGIVLRLLAEQPEIEVRWVVFTGNAARAAEARASAAAFLARAASPRVELHAFRDGFLPWQGAEVKEAFERLKTDFAPSLVLTHALEDAHQDHRLVAELTHNTFRDHLILEYEIPKRDGDLGNPSLLVPLAEETARRKAGMVIRHFPSQRPRLWFREETFLALMRLRGAFSGAPSGFAEGFHCRKMILS